MRKEFFSVSIDDISSWAKDEKIDMQLTKIAEAREYRESQAIRSNGQRVTAINSENNYPDHLEVVVEDSDD